MKLRGLISTAYHTKAIWLRGSLSHSDPNHSGRHAALDDGRFSQFSRNLTEGIVDGLVFRSGYQPLLLRTAYRQLLGFCFPVPPERHRSLPESSRSL